MGNEKCMENFRREIFFVENHYRTPEEVGLIKVDVSLINLGNEKCMQNFRFF